jgi:hypothetical protein
MLVCVPEFRRCLERNPLDEAITVALTAPDCLMVNRDAGSGTRILTDRLLNGARPAGYWRPTMIQTMA